MTDWAAKLLADVPRYRPHGDGPRAMVTDANGRWLHVDDVLAALKPAPDLAAELTDPIAVHANMLRGTIAKPTVEQIIHLYGVDALCKALVPVIVQEADVNKTPKCERDLGNVLTEAAAHIAALTVQVKGLETERDRFEAALARCCLVGGQTYYIERIHGAERRAEAAEAERDALRERVARLEGAAARDVLAERARQVEAEGWTPEHDDMHQNREMAIAAGCYAIFAAGTDEAREATDMPGRYTADGKPIKAFFAWQNVWPWDRSWWKPTSQRRDLVKAGALILAEIERLDRAAISEGGKDG